MLHLTNKMKKNRARKVYKLIINIWKVNLENKTICRNNRTQCWKTNKKVHQKALKKIKNLKKKISKISPPVNMMTLMQEVLE